MIDFRYHLVSLISVFLALAVGIVLGAGPLRENLGDQLAGQVEQLRDEQDTLRSENEQLADRNDQLSTFITEAGPELVAGTLTGREVALVTDHTSSRPSMDRINALLDTAGASVSTRVTLQSALWDPSQADRRAEAVREISAIAPAALGTEGEDSQRLAASVPRLLLPGEDSGLTPELRAQVWEVLLSQQFVAVDGQTDIVPDGVVFASADPEALTVSGEDETLASTRAQSLQQAQDALLNGLAVEDIPTVIAGSTPGNDTSVSLLRAVRGDSRFARLSTTDRLQESDGPLLAVLALVEQFQGGEGDYGTGADADARLPQLPDQTDRQSGPSSSPSDGGGEQ